MAKKAKAEAIKALDIVASIGAVTKEKSISMDLVLETLRDALSSAAKKYLGKPARVEVKVDREKGGIIVSTHQTVVEEVTDPENQISLEDAKAISAELDLAERLGQLVDPGEMLDAVAEAANFLRENFSGVDPNLCERLASETDPRQIRVVIEAHYRKILAEVKDKFDAIAKPKTDEGQ